MYWDHLLALGTLGVRNMFTPGLYTYVEVVWSQTFPQPCEVLFQGPYWLNKVSLLSTRSDWAVHVYGCPAVTWCHFVFVNKIVLHKCLVAVFCVPYDDYFFQKSYCLLRIVEVNQKTVLNHWIWRHLNFRWRSLTLRNILNLIFNFHTLICIQALTG